jgi:hypothetical protein
MQLKGADVDSQNSLRGQTALMYAALRNDLDLVKYLIIDHGANPDITDKYDNTNILIFIFIFIFVYLIGRVERQLIIRQMKRW